MVYLAHSFPMLITFSIEVLGIASVPLFHHSMHSAKHTFGCDALKRDRPLVRASSTIRTSTVHSLLPRVVLHLEGVDIDALTLVLEDCVAVDIPLVKCEVQPVLIVLFRMLLVVTARSAACFFAQQADGVFACLPTLVAFVTAQLMEVFGVYGHLGQVEGSAHLLQHFLFLLISDHDDLITELF